VIMSDVIHHQQSRQSSQDDTTMNKLSGTILRFTINFVSGIAVLLPISALAEMGMLRVVTVPGDAQIMINGKMKGNSPAEAGQNFAIKLDEGEYQVQAIKVSGGIKEYFGEKKVFVVDDSIQTLTLKLKERASQAGKQAVAAKERAFKAGKQAVEAQERAFKASSQAVAAKEWAVKIGEQAIAAKERAAKSVKQAIAAEERAAKAVKLAIAAEERATKAAKHAITAKEQAAQATKNAMATYIPNPEMVSLKAGRFRMGCLESDTRCFDDEKPMLDMNVPAFEIGKFEVTFEMWDACYAQGGCERYPDDNGWGRGKRPVINVTWNNVQEFLAWINKKTGATYRLPTEPEWEYAARAGTTTAYSWGDDVGQNRANCDKCGSQWDNKETAPVGSFAANSWGIHDMHGNVWEWVSGCKWPYEGASNDATSWHSEEDCNMRVVRGGCWGIDPGKMRSANRNSSSPVIGFDGIGFRLARTK
ncbi:MAG: SUMF1/EgtB/PvdO family nonheme iron enzyme, partial [Pseudomonadota bacterium]